MWERAAGAIRSGDIEPDRRIDDANDARRWLTLIFRPEGPVLSRLDGFLNAARKLEPNQHFYLLSEIHTTVLSIVTCAEDFRLDQIEVSDYVTVIQNCLNEVGPFSVAFNGLTASKDCVMAQGFPEGDALDKLRDLLRASFRNSEIRCSIDQRYPIRTAHATLIRFRENLTDPEKFYHLLTQFRDMGWDVSRVDTMTLVFNDWYHRTNVVKDLEVFQV